MFRAISCANSIKAERNSHSGSYACRTALCIRLDARESNPYHVPSRAGAYAHCQIATCAYTSRMWPWTPGLGALPPRGTAEFDSACWNSGTMWRHEALRRHAGGRLREDVHNVHGLQIAGRLGVRMSSPCPRRLRTLQRPTREPIGAQKPCRPSPVTVTTLRQSRGVCLAVCCRVQTAEREIAGAVHATSATTRVVEHHQLRTRTPTVSAMRHLALEERVRTPTLSSRTTYRASPGPSSWPWAAVDAWPPAARKRRIVAEETPAT